MRIWDVFKNASQAKERMQCRYALLSHPQNVPKILDVLEKRFGRPEFVIGKLRDRLLEQPNVLEHNFRGLIKLSTEIQNYVTTVEVLNCPAYLVEPSILNSLVAKLPFSVQVQWGEYLTSLGIFPARIADLCEWLQKKADAYSLLSGIVPQQQPQLPSTSGEKMVPPPNPKMCRFCQKGVEHELSACDKWLKSSVENRWFYASRNRLCFKCLKSANHSAPRCRSPTECTICHGMHHTTLHRQQQPTVPSGLHHRVAPKEEQKLTMLRVLPVRLYGPFGHIDTHALLDEGTSVTLIDADLANELQLKGEPRPLSLNWTGEINQHDANSESVSFGISSINPDAKTFKIHGARTISKLGLPSYSLDVEELAKKWPFIHKGIVSPMHQVKPRILIGQDNWPLILTRKSFSGPWNGPVVSLTWLGWVLHGNAPTQGLKGKYCMNEFQLLHWEDVKEEDSSLHELVRQHVISEDLDGPTESSIDENSAAARIFEETTKFLGDRWETGLLWKSNDPHHGRIRLAGGLVMDVSVED
ncbi:Hypothetical protein NTJ_05612 [Nesidiocoris tenuis]|uniref:Peptidase A2 domain-containing protein n=1 Tax=Nesidiocoris tenuis TaxID=355587 RepID=A0ABN7AKP2_9HEMI|nr:Hypothetical protein NTJ_05612 [Nesidiocoris tenuis]